MKHRPRRDAPMLGRNVPVATAKKLIFLAAVLILILPAKVGFALDSFPATCDAALAKDTLAHNEDSRVTLAVLQLIDETNFNAYKEAFGGSITIPIYDVPVDFGADWNTFRQNRSSFFSKSNYSLDQQFSRNVAISQTSEVAYHAWTTCIIAETRQREVLLARPQYSSGNTVLVGVYWYPGTEGKPGIVQDIRPQGARLQGQAPTEFLAKWTTLTFIREPGQPFVVAINIRNGDSSVVELPAESERIVTASLRCEPVKLSSCRNGGLLTAFPTVCDDASWGQHLPWGPPDPIKICQASESLAVPVYVCSKGGIGTSPNFCNYVGGDPSLTLALRVADSTCTPPKVSKEIAVCVNGGAMGTSGNFCPYPTTIKGDWSSLGIKSYHFCTEKGD